MLIAPSIILKFDTTLIYWVKQLVAAIDWEWNLWGVNAVGTDFAIVFQCGCRSLVSSSFAVDIMLFTFGCRQGTVGFWFSGLVILKRNKLGTYFFFDLILILYLSSGCPFRVVFPRLDASETTVV